MVSKSDKIRLSCTWSLSSNGINPDYSLEGVLVRKDGEDISFRHQLPYFETQFLANPFHRQLLVNNPGAYARHVSQDLDITQLHDYLEQHLAPYMLPSHLVELEKIPMTPNGKVDKNALPNPLAMDAGEEYTAPRNDMEKTLVEIWAGVLNRESQTIGIHGNFFKLGGHSLKAVALTSRIQKQLEVDIPFIQVFKTPTIVGLAQYVTEAGVGGFTVTTIEPCEKREYYPLTSVQKRLYFLQTMDPDSTAYNVPATIFLENALSKEKLETIFSALIQRHEILRTSIETVGEEPRQLIHNHVPFEIQSVTGPLETAVKGFVKPFDLTAAPLLRVALIETGQTRILAVDMHHIICDPISHEVLAGEFQALCADRELPQLELQYRDYTQWQNSDAQQARFEQQKKYWTGIFSDDIPVLDLMTDFSRPQVQSFEGASMNFMMEDDLIQAFKR
ncbi:MAG: non-ribosomal peptide synthetase, partial [bacterium]|nr:non-ribosomal peptide synthetase [bacterium]